MKIKLLIQGGSLLQECYLNKINPCKHKEHDSCNYQAYGADDLFEKALSCFEPIVDGMQYLIESFSFAVESKGGRPK